MTKYTATLVRALIEGLEPTKVEAPTEENLGAAVETLEELEGLLTRLPASERRGALSGVALESGDALWVPAVRNCRLSAGVAVEGDGLLTFAVGDEDDGGTPLATHFSARTAAAHALHAEGRKARNAEADGNLPVPDETSRAEFDSSLVESVKASGWAVPVGRRVEDLDPETLVGVARLSEGGVAHLFAEGGGVVLAMAGSTAGDRRRAVERLPQLPERAYSSRPVSVLFAGGEAGGHYSEESWFGHSATEAPKPKETELDDAAERFRAARFVRPSRERPLDVAAIRRSVRDRPLVRAAVRHATTVDASDAGETLRRCVALVLVARHFFRMVVRRSLAAERPWDAEAERGRMEAAGPRLRRRIVADRKVRGEKSVEITPATTLDAERRSRFAPPAEDPKLRASVERRRESGRAAYDTARAVYLQRCPGLERKLLHLLRREGATPEGEFVSRRLRLAIEAGAEVPESALRGALRSLGEAGKVRRVRSAKTGQVFIAATEPLDETGFRRSLNALIRDGRFGIVNPWAEAGAVGAGGEDDEWERGAEDLEASEAARLAPRRLRNTRAYEQPLPAADLIAEPSAQEEVEAVAEGIA